VSDDVSPHRADAEPGGDRGYEASAPPYFQQPVSPSPYEQTAQFGVPQQQWSPTSGPPASSSAPPWQSSGPPDQYGLPVDPTSSAGFGAPPFGQRRIEPSPPPARSKLVLGLLIGLVAGVLVAGTAGFFVGRGTAGEPAVSAPSTQPSYLAGLEATNRAKFTGELSALAAPWLTDMSGCATQADNGGPQLAPGEQTHVLCRDGGLYVHFVTYSSADAKQAVRGYRQQIALGSQAILPGLEQPGRKLGGVTGAAGTYVEYATKGGKDPALCGVWWDLDNTVSAYYVDVLCDTLGGKWDPLRAVWERHS
jgi:hypothetical protein